jgi:diguanylate cyclase (GGDEF)-like protein/PAS domain S-box-containing protein
MEFATSRKCNSSNIRAKRAYRLAISVDADLVSTEKLMRLRSNERLRAVLPFVVVAIVGILSLLPPPYHHESSSPLLAIGCVVLAVASLAWMSVLPERHWLLVAPLATLFGVLAVARDQTGGGASGLGPLVMLPVLWVVLHGTRAQLWISGGCTALVFIGPLLVVGPPKYDTSDWRRGALWFLVVVLVCPVLQRGVERLRSTALHEKALAGELHSVLRAATEHSIIATDLAGTITMFSEGAERMLGYRAVDVVGRRNARLVHDRVELAQRAAELGIAPGVEVLVHDIPQNGVGSRRWTYRRSDGTTLRVLLTVTRLVDADGVHTGWIGIAQDVTAEELAQHDLVASERRWRALLDHLPDTAVLVVGPDLEFRVAVGAGLDGQGLTGAQGRTLFETSSAVNIAILEPVFRAALAGDPGSVEMRSSRTDAIHELVVVPLPDHEGDPEALVVARDVTLSRERETELRLARDRFERLFEEAPHGTLLLDGSGIVTRVNPAFCTMTDLSSTEIVDQPIRSLPFMLSEESSRLHEFMNGALDRLEMDRTLRAGEPDEIHVSVTAVALRDGKGALQGLLVSVIDVSERARHEAELAHLADHDPLTGLANRRRFDAELTSHLERCREGVATGALLMLDLDNFKQVNDTLGHGAGDHVIVSVAAVLRARMRAGDVVARLGGDEFAVLLPNADRKDAESVAQDLVDLVRDQLRVLGGTAPRTITTSIGVVLVQDAQLTASELMSTADMTMYDAKDAGRDRYALHHRVNGAAPRVRTWTPR